MAAIWPCQSDIPRTLLLRPTRETVIEGADPSTNACSPTRGSRLSGPRPAARDAAILALLYGSGLPKPSAWTSPTTIGRLAH